MFADQKLIEHEVLAYLRKLDGDNFYLDTKSASEARWTYSDSLLARKDSIVRFTHL